jgi:polyribonucleotide 5'-hydroxyl-kinase
MAHTKHIHSVARGHDLSLHFYSDASVVLLDGDATVFGTPLRRYVTYAFPPGGIAIAAVGGNTRVEVSWRDGQSLVVPHDTLGNELHQTLQAQRVEALAGTSSQGRGPTVLVVGNVDQGKSTLCRTLANRCVADGDGALGVAIVDVDVGQPAVACPGSVSAVFLREPTPVDEGLVASTPLSFFFGDKTLTQDTLGRYLDLCAALRQCVQQAAVTNRDFECGGTIINTMGWTDGIGFEVIAALIDIFRVTDVIVTGGDADLEKRVRGSVRNVPVRRYVNTNILTRNGKVRAQARSSAISRYFSGTAKTRLAASRLVVPLAGLTLLDATTLKEVSASSLQPRTLCAVSTGLTAAEAGTANVAGFVLILDVGKTTLSLLAPSSGALPSSVLLVAWNITVPKENVPAITS